MAKFGIRYLYWNSANLKGEQKVPYDQWMETDDTYDTFEAAKERAKQLEEQARPRKLRRNPDYDAWSWSSGPRFIDEGPDMDQNPCYKYLAFKIPEERDHLAREAKRVEAGEYERLPDNMQYYPWCHARLNSERGQIGYYETDLEAQHDRLRWVRLTRYFTSFYGDNDQSWNMMAELGIDYGLHLSFVTSREDIRYVYEHGPESCMSHHAHNFFGDGSEIHPVEAYASPDLELAVLHRGEFRQEGDDYPDNIVGRALCNKNTKQYVRIYGDIRRMRTMLEKEGYTQSSWALGGCRLLKLFARRDGQEFRDNLMMPYLDGNCTEAQLETLDDEYLTIIKPPLRIIGTTAGYYNIPV